MPCSASKSPAAWLLRIWARIISGDLRAIKVAFWSRRKNDSPKIFFPSEYDTGWIKEHGRLVRWRIQRVTVSPQEAGFCGCRQLLAVWRGREGMGPGKRGRTPPR